MSWCLRLVQALGRQSVQMFRLKDTTLTRFPAQKAHHNQCTILFHLLRSHHRWQDFHLRRCKHSIQTRGHLLQLFLHARGYRRTAGIFRGHQRRTQMFRRAPWSRYYPRSSRWLLLLYALLLLLLLLFVLLLLLLLVLFAGIPVEQRCRTSHRCSWRTLQDTRRTSHRCSW